MPSFESSIVLSSRRRLLLTLVGLFCFIIIGTRTVYSAIGRAYELTEIYSWVSFSTSTFIDPTTDSFLAFDKDLNTFWTDRELTKTVYSIDNSPVPTNRLLYIQTELNTTHFPDSPPKKNPIDAILIHNGASQEEYFDFARAREIRLVFFKQAWVDVDRELRFPGLPEYVGEQNFTLKDSPVMQTIPVTGLGPILDSPKFPTNIYQIWVRVEIKNLYAGQKENQTVAIREIDFTEKFRTR